MEAAVRVLVLFLAAVPLAGAGVYDTLLFGDSRETVVKKLQASNMVEQTLDSTYLARTGLNGVFKCKAKLAGLTYHLYFGWNEHGGLNEITLRSGGLPLASYSTALRKAWDEANALFTRVYGEPTQDGDYPDKADFGQSPILVSHVWHKGEKQSILIGPGIKGGKCFLVIRFVNRRVEPVRVP